ncbi:MAG TPA: AraC family ligand binding domain-containing protein [Ramlibacter sp.]|jgi:quercetin dioxygenase-like cupin family protein|nr:AraC family ligand binding domain-containing protein [Ramlibacter sp.]
MTFSLRYPEFEAAERARGCTEVIARSWEPDTVIGTHSHPFHARAVVVQGEMWLSYGGQVQHLKAGDRFDLPPGIPHEERYGAEGATYWVARTNT